MDGWRYLEYRGEWFNILDSFSDALSRPFFSLNLPDKLLLDIINGNLIVVLCFDHRRFVERANKKYPGIYELLDFPSPKINPMSMLSINGKGVVSSVDGQSAFIGNGYETRIIFDQQYPDSLIKWSYHMSDLKKNIDKKKRKMKKETQRKIKEKRKRSRKQCLN